jgi:hypothetical protein
MKSPDRAAAVKRQSIIAQTVIFLSTVNVESGTRNAGDIYMRRFAKAAASMRMTLPKMRKEERKETF